MTPDKRFQFIVTYKGDVTTLLRASGTACPFRLTPEGNTEQEITVWRGPGSDGFTDEQVMKITEEAILKQCGTAGKILAHKWIFVRAEQ